MAQSPLSKAISQLESRLGVRLLERTTRQVTLTAAGSVGADRGGIAIGRLELQRRPETAGQPVRLAPRPVFLAGREELLAELDD